MSCKTILGNIINLKTTGTRGSTKKARDLVLKRFPVHNKHPYSLLGSNVITCHIICQALKGRAISTSFTQYSTPSGIRSSLKSYKGLCRPWLLPCAGSFGSACPILI